MPVTVAPLPYGVASCGSAPTSVTRTYFRQRRVGVRTWTALRVEALCHNHSGKLACGCYLLHHIFERQNHEDFDATAEIVTPCSNWGIAQKIMWISSIPRG
jgi:hypothetical protein